MRDLETTMEACCTLLPSVESPLSMRANGVWVTVDDEMKLCILYTLLRDSMSIRTWSADNGGLEGGGSGRLDHVVVVGTPLGTKRFGVPQVLPMLQKECIVLL